jgi:4-amino-4-deoxy-L-arabinose transferase-like glycosyltransferase
LTILSSASASDSQTSVTIKPLYFVLIALIAGAGIFLRVHRSATFAGPGPDELYYKSFVEKVDNQGLLSYPKIVQEYIAYQSRPETPLILPPLRVTFIVSAYLWKQATGADALSSTHAIACLASILTLLIAGAFAWRLGGLPFGLGVFALMAFAPMQIYSAQRALIDGFFALWALLALWALWEHLQEPRSKVWLSLYGLSMAAMVLTKESAFFVYIAFWGILIGCHWLKFGRVSLPLYAMTIAAPVIAVLILLLAAGGVTELIAVYRVNVQKSILSAYALNTGDGPWHRYLIDLLLMEPALLLLAIGGLFRVTTKEKAAPYLSLFIGLSYLVMCQVTYGMNLRYASIWDMPLRWLAFWNIMMLTSSLPSRARTILVSGIVAALCLMGWQEYHLFFVQAGIYDPIPSYLGRALSIFK